MEETLTTLKLDPRAKHFAQAVARLSGNTFGALIDQLLSDYLARATVDERGRGKLVSELMSETWSEHEADRIALLGNRFPDALTEKDRILWQRIVCESQHYWLVPLTGKPIKVTEKTFNFPLFREEFEQFDELTRNAMIACANDLKRQRELAANWPIQQHPFPPFIPKGGNK
jgi:hypothetical protein